jgi:hypothetical protein
VFRINVEQFALVANQQTYTMGTGGNFNTTRPVKLVPGCKYTLSNGVDRQLTVLTDRKSWDEIPYKALQAPPQALFYDEGCRSRRATSTRRRTRRTRSTSIRGSGCRTSRR